MRLIDRVQGIISREGPKTAFDLRLSRDKNERKGVTHDVAEMTRFKTGENCVQHHTVVVSGATKDKFWGRLDYAYTPRWPKPHHLAASPITIRLKDN